MGEFMKSRRNSIVRLSMVAVAAAALSLSACATEEGPGGGGAWVPAGCVAGNTTGGTVHPDIQFSGATNVRGNGTLSGNWADGNFVVSSDGSCSGVKFAAMTIVQAADQAAANSLCALLGAGTDPATATAGSGYSLPADAWACSETFFL